MINIHEDTKIIKVIADFEGNIRIYEDTFKLINWTDLTKEQVREYDFNVTKIATEIKEKVSSDVIVMAYADKEATTNPMKFVTNRLLYLALSKKLSPQNWNDYFVESKWSLINVKRLSQFIIGGE